MNDDKNIVNDDKTITNKQSSNSNPIPNSKICELCAIIIRGLYDSSRESGDIDTTQSIQQSVWKWLGDI